MVLMFDNGSARVVFRPTLTKQFGLMKLNYLANIIFFYIEGPCYIFVQITTMIRKKFTVFCHHPLAHFTNLQSHFLFKMGLEGLGASFVLLLIFFLAP